MISPKSQEDRDSQISKKLTEKKKINPMPQKQIVKKLPNKSVLCDVLSRWVYVGSDGLNV